MDEIKMKNLCAQIPEPLHNRVRKEQELSGKNLSDYMTWRITEFFEEGRTTTMGDMRTLAVQVPAELFERLDKYLADHKLKKKAFIIDLITRALEEDEADAE